MNNLVAYYFKDISMKRSLFTLLGILLLPTYAYTYSVTFAWDYAQGEDPAVVYRLYRQVDCMDAFEVLAELDISTQTFMDTTGIDGAGYCYLVTAIDNTGQESEQSNIL